MFSVIKSSQYTNDTVLIQGACVALDTKPTSGIANGSMCIEIDTGKIYAFDEESGDWIEQPGAGGGGGGGGSDFSTATVTLINTGSDDELQMQGAFIFKTDESTPRDSTYWCVNGYVGSNTSTVVLYKGLAVVEIFYGGNFATIESVTGDAVEDDGYIYITGDCTITASYGS